MNRYLILFYTAILPLLSACSGNGQSGDETQSISIGTPQFVDITEEAGLGNFTHETGGYGQSLMPEIVGGGGGFIDYDKDGWQDIVLVAGAPWSHRDEAPIEGIYLYRNNGNGTFTDVSEESGLKGVHAYGFGITVGDVENDGDEDFYVTTLHKNLLFRNEGGQFVEVGEEAGLQDVSVWSTSAVFFDANLDGWVDLFVGSYVDWTPETDLTCMYEGEKAFCTPQEYTGRASHFYINQGDGTFVNRSAAAGFWTEIDTTLDKTLGVAEFDYNRDGWPDLVIGNDTENDFLYSNQGDGTFVERGLQSGVAVSQHGSARAGMGIDTGVVDSTGQVSMFVGNFTEETVGVYRYSGNGQFVERAAASRIGYPSMRTLTFGLMLFDADNDTDLDLFTGNGHVLRHIDKVLEGVTFRQRNQLYLNRGDGVFDEYVPESGPLTDKMIARGTAYGDVDRDGDMDVLVIENDGPAHLWRNDTDGGRYLKIYLEGEDTNRSALGSRVIVWVGGLAMERRVKTGSSFLTSSEIVAHFGMGQHQSADSIQVIWQKDDPQVFYGVKANQEWFLKAGKDLEPYYNQNESS